jgi:hypothetical protein
MSWICPGRQLRPSISFFRYRRGRSATAERHWLNWPERAEKAAATRTSETVSGFGLAAITHSRIAVRVIAPVRCPSTTPGLSARGTRAGSAVFNNWRPGSGLGDPTRISQAIWTSWTESKPMVSTMRLHTVSLEATACTSSTANGAQAPLAGPEHAGRDRHRGVRRTGPPRAGGHRRDRPQAHRRDQGRADSTGSPDRRVGARSRWPRRHV